MDTPIVCRFRLTAEEFLAAQRCHVRHVLRKSIQRLASLLVALLGLAGLLGMLSAGFAVWPAGFVALAVYWFFVHRFVWRWSVRRSLRKRPDAGAEVVHRISQEGIHSEVGAILTSNLAWPGVAKSVETSQGFLIYPQDAVFFWVPRSGFEGPGQAEECAKVLRQAVRRHVLVA
ncbi:MAG: YcxB family protein [Thermoanaerobaculaceae bacterium]